jgi:DNA repair protein RecN (Recombination protein N)
MVFDEVDAGVGGRAAVEIGRRLAALARNHQVIVVTHLPQVAAFADHHIVIGKTTGKSKVTSSVTTLDRDGRVAELARMLAGLGDSDTGRAHAEELLDTAEGEKAVR